MVSPDNLSIVIILDLLLMTRVHGISRLVWLEKAGLLLDRIWLHNNVMLHQLWLVTSLWEDIRINCCFQSLHYLQQSKVDQFEMLSTYCIRSLTCEIASWRTTSWWSCLKTHLGETDLHLILRIALFIQCRLNQARNILLLLFLQKKVFSG